MLISIILPCLNEEESIGETIDKVENILSIYGLNGEVIVVDNESDDRSFEIIMEKFDQYQNLIAITELERGYGNTCRTGLYFSCGDFIIIGDSDGSYDFSEIPNFIRELGESDLVLGSRYLGRMEKGSMPFSHKYIGNPLIRLFLKMNGVKTTETSTGFIGMKRELLNKLDLKQGGMEFSSELLVKSVRQNAKIKEIPINYGIRKGKSKINEFTDGIRHLNYLIIKGRNA